ncbi:Cell wall-associated hydrolase, NlpC family [Trichlorobacter thiogenes]|uniref:Cell wall-associated hydrolase, NlpC family n=1 Tax=Trichlorobacter thiogenes TaxID=115783 RepID=A0A1T4Q5C3_9BACT|nr:SH3 domain-containing protein [Trichlorobacter thiogenes]SJZ98864.1 Cell wall-associated hydrolase, NlpC family [Trichlorobacter thiogenes]
MTRTPFTCSIVAATLLFITAGCAPQHTAVLVKQGTTAASTDDFNRSKPEELPSEIEDIQKIPQNLRRFTATLQPLPTSEESANALRRFRTQHFSPWTEPQPTHNLTQSIQGMKDIAKTTWYGENRLKVKPERIKVILGHADLDQLPSMNQPGIAIAPTFMRGLPNLKPLYETSDDFPFDQLQYSEVKPNEPVRILHLSDTGAWAFVETAYGLGWVKAGTVLPVDRSMQQRLTSADLVVITMDFAVIRDDKGKAMPQPRIGALYPLVREEPDYWLVELAVPGEDDWATLKTARILKKDAQRFPLPFNAETVTHIGNELLKTPYGWGELFRDRDCSATTRDFFLPFGIWLPRNSREQLHSGPFVSLANLSKPDKEKLLIQQGVPFRTIVHRKGHIMLYAGLFDGRPVVLHTTWAIRFKTKSGQEEKFYVGRTVLTTLEAGFELPLSRGTLLDHVDGILTLPAK